MPVKLIMTERSDLTDVEVEIRYAKMNDDVRGLVSHIEKHDFFIYGADNGRQYKVRINDIYYAESVDKKTFIYTKTEVFKTELRLYQFLEKVRGFAFIQVSRACVVNINVIDSLQSMVNSRLQATLANGEKVDVSRTFLPQIKAAFIGKEDV